MRTGIIFMLSMILIWIGATLLVVLVGKFIIPMGIGIFLGMVGFVVDFFVGVIPKNKRID